MAPPTPPPARLGPVEEGDEIRVAIADDDPVTQRFLRDLIEREEDMRLVAAAADTDDAVGVVVDSNPHVAIVDWEMPGAGGATAIAEIAKLRPEVRVVGFTAKDAAEGSYSMMSAGAVAFLQKGCPEEEIIETIRSAIRW